MATTKDYTAVYLVVANSAQRTASRFDAAQWEVESPEFWEDIGMDAQRTIYATRAEADAEVARIQETYDAAQRASIGFVFPRT